MTVASGVVQRHLCEIEQRLDRIEHRLRALEGLQSDIKRLRQRPADLTHEVAELQEA